ncbi:MAG: fructosamine kinase family protein [Gammaproteobacteria bacterium]|nr:fructosamine kinase family protein [Gammaproteobacteria bacterium]MCP5195388.1 fructosamine kinase family protein [Gammaproteobacteria bacterium]
MFWNGLEQQIGAATGQRFSAGQRHTLSGGCINQAWRIGSGDREYFMKAHAAAGLSMFAAEAAGLAELAASHTVRVPKPVCWGSVAGQAYLVLEYLPLGGSDTARTMETLGRQLALLHRQPQPYFGWQRDNTIGSTPQPNERHADWIAFWSKQRLGFQLQRAADNGHGGVLQRQGEALLARFAGLFASYAPTPSLLHGDLWAGNAGCTIGGEPVIFDPAVYYGDREADLAMTELFGGFPARFYAAYRETWPLDAGYPQRRTLYNLYHILNHLNLFGGGYRSQAERMMGQLLAELG